MPWNALGRGYSAILAQHYPAPHYRPQPNGKLFPIMGRKIRPVFGKIFPQGWGKVSGTRLPAAWNAAIRRYWPPEFLNKQI